MNDLESVFGGVNYAAYIRASYSGDVKMRIKTDDATFNTAFKNWKDKDKSDVSCEFSESERAEMNSLGKIVEGYLEQTNHNQPWWGCGDKRSEAINCARRNAEKWEELGGK